MTDVFSKEKRSELMSRIRSRNTKPEIKVRRWLHSMGYRFRLHRKDLPGTPDIILPKYQTVIFINGCFWHGHDCHLFKWPKTRPEFWRKKITSNKKRDEFNLRQLTDLGWNYVVLWECQLKGREDFIKSQILLEAVLGSPRVPSM